MKEKTKKERKNKGESIKMEWKGKKSEVGRENRRNYVSDREKERNENRERCQNRLKIKRNNPLWFEFDCHKTLSGDGIKEMPLKYWFQALAQCQQFREMAIRTTPVFNSY